MQLKERDEVIERLNREKRSEADSLSDLNHELAAMRSSLQVKEDQLTQTTDKLLQVSVFCCSFINASCLRMLRRSFFIYIN